MIRYFILTKGQRVPKREFSKEEGLKNDEEVFEYDDTNHPNLKARFLVKQRDGKLHDTRPDMTRKRKQ